MMTIDPLLQTLPNLLENQPQLFSIADLQDLQQLLADVENESPEIAEETLIDWCIERELRDALRNFSSDRAEVKKVKPSQANQSKRTTNFFQELSQQVKDKLTTVNQKQSN
jgi:hypothetical protein